MSVESNVKQSIVEVFSGKVLGVPEELSEYGLLAILSFFVILFIWWQIKDSYKEYRALFFGESIYLKESERKPIDEYPVSEQSKQQINNQYTYYVDQFQKGKFKDNYRKSLGLFLLLISRVTGESKFRVAIAVQNKSLVSGVFSTNIFTQKSYEFCIRLALFYPLIFLIISWVLGGSGNLGEITFLGDDVPILSRSIYFLGIILMTILLYRFKCTSNIEVIVFYESFLLVFFMSSVATFVVVVDGIFSGRYLGVFVYSFVFFSVFSVSFILAVSRLLSEGTTLIIGTTVSITISLMFSNYIYVILMIWPAIYFIEYFYKHYNRGEKWFWFLFCSFLLIYSVLIIVTILFNLDSVSDNKYVVLPLFLGVLPVINSLLDWVSLGFTRAFLLKLYKGVDSLAYTVLLAIADLVLAVVFLLVLVANTVLIISLVNLLSVAVSDRVVLELDTIFRNLYNGSDWQDNLWIHAMMLSTLIPTFLHFVITLIGLLMPLLMPLTKYELQMLKEYKPRNLNAKIFWAAIYGKPIVICVSVSIVAFIFYPVYFYGDIVFDFLFSQAVNIAEFIHPEGIDRADIFAAPANKEASSL